jgi:hypothetical protein
MEDKWKDLTHLFSYLFITPWETDDGDYHQDRVSLKAMWYVFWLVLFTPATGRHLEICSGGEIVVSYEIDTHWIGLECAQHYFEFCCTEWIAPKDQRVIIHVLDKSYDFREICRLINKYYNRYMKGVIKDE